MALDIGHYQYVPTYVEAVCVVHDNLKAIAEWCGGSVAGRAENKHHIVVPVLNPKTVRDTQAFIGQWVVKTERHGFKVYHGKAFLRFFIPSDIMPEVEYDKIVNSNSVETDLFINPKI